MDEPSLCEFAGCGRKRRHAKGLCVSHRRMQLRGEELRPLRRYDWPSSPTCSGPECDRPVDAVGLCQAHAKQQRQTGELWALTRDARSQRQRERWQRMSPDDKARRMAGWHTWQQKGERPEEWIRRQSESAQATWARKRGEGISLPDRMCRNCGQQFTPQSGSHWTCTVECRNLGYRLRRHGLTLQRYHELLAEQGGACALCGGAKRGWARGADLHIDHCHDSGRVRGLLCGDCNTALGRFGDDPAKLRRAADYLERTSEM